ncbi:MAG: hypothetical protein KDA61_07515, partial [Planctomycetales bacterium]|nr:hypothetical protein [Planctomycetales bacterium]
WILKASVDANRLAGLQPFIESGRLTGVTGPTALVVNPKPGYGYLVGTNMGPPGDDRDSVLVFYSPYSGRIALQLKLELYDVVALAYSPSGNLYAADFAWRRPEEGGIYRIDQTLVDGRQACQPVKIAEIRRPTGLAFTDDATMWATSFGEGDDQQPHGELIRVRGEF